MALTPRWSTGQGGQAAERWLVDAVRESARPLRVADDDEPLLSMARDAKWVLLGEASHGTHEFYRERARLTQRLIRELGFDGVVVEADWPDALRVNRYVRGQRPDADAVEALAGFERFPSWMWRNADVLNFLGWLRDHNDALPDGASKVGFYGMDLYGLHASIQQVLAYLSAVDPAAATAARERYACFDSYAADPQEYGAAVAYGDREACEEQVIEQLVELRQRLGAQLGRSDHPGEDEAFYAEQNAVLVRDAERYYRSMFEGRTSSWNLRDEHMAATLEALATHLGRRGRTVRLVVWAHNSHLGDASATEMGDRGELNVGQLMRQQHGRAAVLVGFTTYEGSVTAATDWGGAAERKVVTPALGRSYEALFHELGMPRFLLPLRDAGEGLLGINEPMLERAIGVIYRPQTERFSHYFEARLAAQFDAVIHIDHTRAVEPLERTSLWEVGEPPETFPSTL